MDFPTTGSCCRRVVSCVHFTIATRLSYLLFDASNYVLRPCLYCCWSLVLFCDSDGVSWWRLILQCIVMQPFQRLINLLRKLAVCKLDLSRGVLLCHGVLDHGLNLHWNIPLSHNVYLLCFPANNGLYLIKNVADKTKQINVKCQTPVDWCQRHLQIFWQLLGRETTLTFQMVQQQFWIKDNFTFISRNGNRFNQVLFLAKPIQMSAVCFTVMLLMLK